MPVPPERNAEQSRSVVVPFARALNVLAVFTPSEKWLGNRELAARTGLPASTISRIVQTLVALGYLIHDAQGRKYRLAPSVLALGYGATVNSEIQQVSQAHMQGFARRHRLHVNLSSRDRLDMMVLESCSSPEPSFDFTVQIGVRLNIASSPTGWAFLGALPELERFFLIENIERRMPREWQQQRRRAMQALAQVRHMGFCTALGEWGGEIGVAAAPLMVENHAPLVLTCVGPNPHMTRARVEREIGPQLLSLALAVQRDLNA